MHALAPWNAFRIHVTVSDRVTAITAVFKHQHTAHYFCIKRPIQHETTEVLRQIVPRLNNNRSVVKVGTFCLREWFTRMVPLQLHTQVSYSIKTYKDIL